jgi:cytochrome c nitrite reductase small subunit
MIESPGKYLFLRMLFLKLVPEGKWRIPIVILWSVFFGMGLFVMKVSNAFSYLSDDPKACINCHIMTAEYSTWMHGSHGRDTKCVDCHIPHENVVLKYLFKANDGLRHATMFTLRLEPQVIKMHEAGQDVVQRNCKRCHYNQLQNVSALNVNLKNYEHGQGMLCWKCHREVPHGRVHSLASTPHAIVPGLSPAVPEWLIKNKKK